MTTANHKEKTRWTRSRLPIFGGKAEILQTTDSGDVWQFRVFIAAEKKYVRKSLRTTDLDTAIARAETKYLKIFSDLESGKKLFGLKLYELADAFLEYKQSQIPHLISAGRFVTIKSQIKHFLAFKGAKIRLSELDRRSAFDYAIYRRKLGAKDVTIRNEQSTINAMFRHGFENGLCSIAKLEFEKIRIREFDRRDTFTVDEYQELYKFLRSWASSKNTLTAKELAEKQLIRDLILILSNTMLRVGEALNLKWSDILSVNYRSSERYQLVCISVRGATSKTGKSREVVTRGGGYFERLRLRSEDVSGDDYIFSAIGDGQSKLSKQKLYKYWAQIMSALDIDYKVRNVTYYSLRHFGITARLSAGVSVWDISKIAGTGIANIERHYGHASREMMQRAALKGSKELELLFN